MQILRPNIGLDNETYESMRQELRDYSKKRIEVLRIFHEYGIFFTHRGLNVKEFSQGQLKTIPF